MEALQIDFLEEVLLIATGLLLLIQAIYYLGLYSRIYRREKAVAKGKVTFADDLPPVSVVVCTNDQTSLSQDDLQANLECILEQDYPLYEVIVINDGHTDDIEETLAPLEARYPHLYHSFVPRSSRYVSRKKLAITLGIKASRYDWIVVTEPYCRPQSPRWLRLMARNFTPGTEVVLGYSGYQTGHGWTYLRMCYDNLLLSLRYLGFALGHRPYMGIGRNMAYRKDLFHAQGGFTAHLQLLRGDDDLLINHIANKTNTRVETHPDAAVRTAADRRSRDGREERIGYAMTARLYHGIQRYLAGFETITRLLLHAAWLCTLVIGLMHLHFLVAGLALLAFVLRLILQIGVTNRASKALGDTPRYYLTLPLMDVLQPLQSLRWKLHSLFRKKSDFLRK